MNIVIFCTIDAGLFCVKLALKKGLKVKKIIGLSPKSVVNIDKISGYVDVKNFCKKYNIDYCYVDDYSLASESKKIIPNSTDLFWICGWQRLIPERFLEIPKYATIGSHGSCDGIVKGRGRSPQNWAILLGKTI